MKVAVVAANGRVGRLVVKEARARGLDVTAIVRGEKPNDQDYERDLKTHEITLKACGL